MNHASIAVTFPQPKKKMEKLPMHKAKKKKKKAQLNSSTVIQIVYNTGNSVVSSNTPSAQLIQSTSGTMCCEQTRQRLLAKMDNDMLKYLRRNNELYYIIL